MIPGLGLFVKTPGRSPVKSRLWPALGREAAEALYLDCAAAAGECAEALQQRGDARACWAIAEPGADIDGTAPWPGFAHEPQGDGDLGARMARVYDALLARHGGAVLVGTDVPQMTADLLAAACTALASGGADVVLGPSDDGGFWLVGGRVPLPRSTWTAPRYSSVHARADFINALPAGVRVHTLAPLRDLDEPEDLAAVAAALAALPQPTPAQVRVLRRLDALLATMPP
ncbi:MAG: DUF2064 domain-containing protein [Silanimonas sp.]